MNEQEQAKALQQAQDQQRMGRAVQGGMQMLLDENVVAPIKYADGISDLKWLLRKILAGEYGIDMDPKVTSERLKAAGQPPALEEDAGGKPLN